MEGTTIDLGQPNLALVTTLGRGGFVTVFQAGFTADDSRPWLAMEYAEGGTLQDHLDRSGGRIPWDLAVAWLIPICDAVQAAHDLTILHRDIKPENILLDRSGKPLLSDFGIASLADESDRTQVASMAHAAPEMFLDQPRTERSDVFSLGTTLYQLVTGEPPFGWSQPERVASLAHLVPPLPPEVGAPAWLGDVLESAMAADPSHRCRSAGELKALLADGLGDRPVSFPEIPRSVVEPPGPVEPGSSSPETVLVGHPDELRAMKEGTTWAPSRLMLPTPDSARGSDGASAPTGLPRWALPLAGLAVAAAGVALFVVSGLSPEDDGAASPAPSTVTAPTTPTAGAGNPAGTAGDAAAGFTSETGLLADLDLGRRLAAAIFADVRSIPGSTADEGPGVGPIDLSALAPSVLSTLAIDPGDHGFTAGDHRVFTYPDHQLESAVLLFSGEAEATGYVDEIERSIEPVPHEPGAPRADEVELYRPADTTIMAVGRVGVAVTVVAVTAESADPELFVDIERFTVVPYGRLLVERVGDVGAGRPPVAAWLAVNRNAAPFRDPAVVEALEAALDDELAFEVLGGRIAVAAYEGVASVDFADLRSAMVADQPGPVTAVEPLLGLAPLTIEDRWWCQQEQVADDPSCFIFDESGRQLGGEEGLVIFEVLTTEAGFDAGVLVVEFVLGAGVELDVVASQLSDAEFGTRQLNSYYEALVFSAT